MKKCCPIKWGNYNRWYWKDHKEGDFVKLEKLLLEPGIVRFYRNMDEFKDAIAKGENIFYVGKHSDIGSILKSVSSNN